MTIKTYSFVGAILLAAAMWFWVQHVAIPHQQSEALLTGSPRGNLSDLYPRWLGARERLLHGRDPYGSDITSEIQTGYYGRPIDPSRPNDPKDQQAFAYPLYVVFVLAPTVSLPFPVVQHLFLRLLVFLVAISVPLWFGALGWRISQQTLFAWIILTLGCFPAIQGFRLQQLTLLVCGLVALAMRAVVRGRLVGAGALLALSTIKPQLVAITLFWLLLWSVGKWRERQRLVWSFFASMSVLLIGAELLQPGWIGEFRQASAAYYRYTGGGRSVLDVALTPLAGRPLAAILVVIAVVFFWRLRHAAAGSRDFCFSLALAMSVTLVVIPMFAPYNQLLLLPAVMLIVRRGWALWRGSTLTQILLVLAGLCLFWPWIASVILVTASIFLPAETVQRAWALPLYTSLAIPVTTLALLLVGRKVLRANGDATTIAGGRLQPDAASE